MARDQAPAPRRIAGNAWFFPAATIHAIVVVPLSVLAMLGAAPWLRGLSTPAGHAHEMLFGFALAVVAGNQLGPRTRRVLAAMMAAWLLARVAFVVAPASRVAIGANVLFPGLLAYHVAPRLVGSAKKWRNQALPGALLAICASAVASTVAMALQPGEASRPIVDTGVALFALLLLFMGGRLIAPTVAGQMYRQGGSLDARVQPRIEGALIAVMALAIVALASDAFVQHAGPARIVAGLALVVAGVLVALRLVRWQLWRLQKRPDLLCLGAGYAWLAIGLVAFGLAHARVLGSPADETLAIHVITIGSLGTLTLNVMAMTRMLTLRRAAAETSLPVVATLLLAAATLLRLLAGFADPAWALGAAAACWSLAYCLVLVLLVTGTKGPPLRMQQGSDQRR